jgi:hypothetical protein
MVGSVAAGAESQCAPAALIWGFCAADVTVRQQHVG